MRSPILALAVAGLSLGNIAPTRADDEFMRVCTETTDQKTCQCMSTKIPPEKRASAIDADAAPGSGIVACSS